MTRSQATEQASSATAPETLRVISQQLVGKFRMAPRDQWTMDMWHVLRQLLEDEKHNRGIFNEPVDDKIVYGYYNVITNPMDLGTIRCRLEDKFYPAIDDFAADVRLVFTNAMAYNLPEHWVHVSAKHLLSLFEERFKQAKQKLNERLAESHSCVVCEGRTCGICSQRCLEYAHPEIRCSPPCKAKIPRNATYYRIGGDRGQHWCMRCYSHLNDEFIGLLGQKLRKSDLEKCVNNEVYREAWVKCPKCASWTHEICSMHLLPLCGPSPFAPSPPGDASSSSSSSQNHSEREFTCMLCLAGVAPISRAPRCSPRSASLAATEHLHRVFPRCSPRSAAVANATAAALFNAPPSSQSSPVPIPEVRTSARLSSAPEKPRSGPPSPSASHSRFSSTGEESGLSPRSRITAPVPAPSSSSVPSRTVSPRPSQDMGAGGAFKQNNAIASYLVPFCAETLPRSEMGDFLENRLRETAVEELMRQPRNIGVSLLNPEFSREEAERVASTIKVRVVSSCQMEGPMEARICRWVQMQSTVVGKSDPLTSFPHRAKTICIFQESSPADTQLAFALYVQEYGINCPEQSVNHGAVYISYLDSVPYIQPRRLRTPLYKELMLSYFVWVRARGFRTCYIWACPPQKGDAYVMHVHPQWHRNPSTDRLRKWYNSIFKQARDLKLVDKDTTLYDKHLANFKPLVHTRRTVASSITTTAADPPMIDKFKLESLPYFAGDYCQGELEVILAQLEMIDSDLTQTKIRPWWQLVWGPNAVIDVVEPSAEDLNAFSANNDNDDKRLFDLKGFPKPGPLILVKAAVAPPSRDTLLQYEHKYCSVSERDEWIMRKVSAAVKPQKDNFLVISFSELKNVSESSGHGEQKRMRLTGAEGGYDVSLNEEDTKQEPAVGFTRSLPPSTLRSDLSDPDDTLPRSCFESRIGLLDLSIMQHLQFDTWRRARYSTAVLLCYLHRALSQNAQ